ncbi:MAG: hypothetical protein ACLRWQ_12630 [Flavonifractor plautii]
MLPMSGNVNLSRELGMRHRAGIGASEHTDAGWLLSGGDRLHLRGGGRHAQAPPGAGDSGAPAPQ